VTGLSLLLLALLSAIPPLSDEQRRALAGATDGPVGFDAALAALADNARTWTTGTGDAPIRLELDAEAVLKSPVAYRGDLFRLRGILQQQAHLAPPLEHIAEWYVRDEARRPLLVYVLPSPGVRVREGEPVELIARFGRVINATAADGRERSYPAFVGAVVPAAAGQGAGSFPFGALALAVAVMGGVFVVLFIHVRRSRGVSPARPRVAADGDAAPLDADAGLPDDPAEALAELRRRAGSGCGPP
jgi:hypothetical protein